MRVPACLALAALAAAPAAAVAQWRAAPMIVPAPAGAEVQPGRFDAAATADELLVVDPASGAAARRPHGALLASTPWPFALPPGAAIRAGSTRANGADAGSEVACTTGAPGSVLVRYASSPSVAVDRTGASPAGRASFAHVMPHAGDTFVWPSPDVGSGLGYVRVGDDDVSLFGGTQLERTWRADGLGALASGAHEVFGAPLSPAAAALGLDDLVMPTGGGVFLLVHRPPTPDLRYAAPPVDLYAGLELAPVLVGGPSALARPPWLPASIAAKGDALGAAALDLDGDGLLDLLFAYGSAVDGASPGHLVAVRGTGDPAELASGAWEDVTGAPALALRDPALVRALRVGGEPAAAIWDRGLDAVVVLWRESGALRTWRGEARGRHLRDLRVADVVGSAAPDLFAVAEDVLVWPDLGDAPPVLAWSAGSPGSPERGVDHRFSVQASDADGALSVAWFVGDPHGAPVATATVPAGPGAASEYLHAGTLLCAPPPQTLAVTVRATDALGVFDELSAALDVPFPPPALAIQGAPPEGALALPPGGTSISFEGGAGSRCGATAFAWSGSFFDAVPDAVEDTTATTTRRAVAIPEERYGALLGVAAPDVALVALDGGVPSAPARLALALDARGLVAVRHAADVAALAPGDVALLRTVVRSRLGVPLARVRVVDLLGGLAPAGPPRVSGAAVADTLRDGAEVVLAELPGGGAEVVIELPVRSAGARGASSVEVRSSGGHLLTAAARAPAEDRATPGCGCGASGAGAEAVLVLGALAALARRRRRRAT